MKWMPGLLLEQVSDSTANAYYPATHTESVTRFASNGFSIFHIACLFMANNQIQSATTAQNYLKIKTGK